MNLFWVNGTFKSYATATAADVLTWKTSYVNGSKITGTHTAQNHTYGVAAEIAKTFGSSTECEASVSLSHTIGVGTYIVFAGVSKTDGTNHDAYLDFFSPMVNVTRSIAAGEYIMRATSKIWSFYSYIWLVKNWLKLFLVWKWYCILFILASKSNLLFLIVFMKIELYL